MSSIFIIYPTTLFKNISVIKELVSDSQLKKIVIIEDPTYFTNYKFHKQKIILHRASMKYYYDYLLLNFGPIIEYINYDKAKLFYKKIFESKKNIHLYDPIDHNIVII